MKRSLIAALGLIAVFAATPGPRRVAWSPSPSADVTGYYLYWTAGQSSWVPGQRVAVSTNLNYGGTNIVFDLNVLTLGPGVWAFTTSATNASGAESDFSNTLLWTNGPAVSSPSNLRVAP